MTETKMKLCPMCDNPDGCAFDCPMPTREELLDALAAVVGMHTFAYLDKGIGTNTRDGKALLNARALLQRAGRITEGGRHD